MKENNSRADFQKFVIKLAVFMLPFIFIFCFSSFVLMVSGELTPIDRVIEEQNQTDRQIYLGLAYSDPTRSYKIRSLVLRRPEFVILGTSRTTQFRSSFIVSPKKFYNASKAIARVTHLRRFLDSIPIGCEPRVIVLGLDQYFFSPRWENLKEVEAVSAYPSKQNWLDILQYGYFKVPDDFLKGKFSLNDLLRRRNNRIGINAVVNGNGLRNDGSYYYAREIREIDNSDKNYDYRFRNTIELVNGGGYRFEYSSEILKGAIEELDLFLRECKSRSIYVVAFLPPYPHVVYEKIAAMKDKYAYIIKLGTTLQSIFPKYGYQLYDFSDLAVTGASDKEMIDGLHTSEKASLRIFIRMSLKNKTLRKYVDVGNLKKELNASNNYYSVIYDEEL